MFGKCLWYIVPQNCLVFDLFQKVYYVFSEFCFSPHITIKTNVDDKYIQEYMKKKIPIPNSISLKYPLVVQCSSVDNFYCLFLDVEGIDIQNAHLSLAYRFNKPFTQSEINLAQNILREHSVLSNLSFKPLLGFENCNIDSIGGWKGHILDN